MKKLPGWIFLFFITNAAAQSGTVAVGSSAVDTVLNQFISTQREVLPVYNGRLFIAYASNIEGHPFYPTRDWQQGSILYDGNWYHDMTMLYDGVQDVLIVRHPNGVLMVLNSDRVEQFKITAGRIYFIRLYAEKDNVPKTGFYQLVVPGEVPLYARRTKFIEEKIVGNELQKKFLETFSFYTAQNNEFIHLRKAKSLLGMLKTNKQKVTQYMNSQDVSYKREPERAMTLIAEYNNKLQ